MVKNQGFFPAFIIISIVVLSVSVLYISCGTSGGFSDAPAATASSSTNSESDSSSSSSSSSISCPQGSLDFSDYFTLNNGAFSTQTSKWTIIYDGNGTATAQGYINNNRLTLNPTDVGCSYAGGAFNMYQITGKSYGNFHMIVDVIETASINSSGGDNGELSFLFRGKTDLSEGYRFGVTSMGGVSTMYIHEFPGLSSLTSCTTSAGATPTISNMHYISINPNAIDSSHANKIDPWPPRLHIIASGTDFRYLLTDNSNNVVTKCDNQGATTYDDECDITCSDNTFQSGADFLLLLA